MSGFVILAQETTETPAPSAPAAAEATAQPAPGDGAEGAAGGEEHVTGTKVAEEIDGGNGPQNSAPGGFQPSMLLMMGVMLVVLYFVMFRPQKKQEKKRREMLSAMKKNDHVVTIGGIHGVVYSVDESGVVLKIDERNDVRIRVEKTHVGRVLTDEEDQAAKQA
ncbi:MAG: preprotein translocase subunit YajC [Phycisphaerae bacterium]|nr:preprotein translocase subunit YajC [Phycisphaerae bacterium]